MFRGPPRNSSEYLLRAARRSITGDGMNEKTVELDLRRGMAAQKATELRRLLSEGEANQEQLRARQEQLEEQLLAAPALTWADAAEKARYLLALFASSPAAQDPRRQLLIARVLEDFIRLSADAEPDTSTYAQNFLHARC